MQIKRMIAVLAALTLALSVAGCGSADTKENTSAQTEQVQQAEQAKRGSIKISQKSVKELRERSDSLADKDIADVMNPKINVSKTVSIKIPVETGEKYFAGKTAKERSDVVVMALDAWFSGKEGAYV